MGEFVVLMGMRYGKKICSSPSYLNIENSNTKIDSSFTTLIEHHLLNTTNSIHNPSHRLFAHRCDLDMLRYHSRLELHS